MDVNFAAPFLKILMVKSRYRRNLLHEVNMTDRIPFIADLRWATKGCKKDTDFPWIFW